MLPAELQRRQAAVADAQLQAALAAERQQFAAERQRLDRQLADQQRALQEREAELQRLQLEEEERRRQREQEERQRRRDVLGAVAAAAAPSVGIQSLRGNSHASPAAGGSLAPLPAVGYPGQRRSVGAALAAAGALPPAGLGLASSSASPQLYAQAAAVPPGPAASHATSYRSTPPEAAQLPLPRTNGRRVPAAAPAPPPVAAAVPPPPPAVAVAAAGPSGEDPLARARRQVLAAKSYLRQVAEMGGSTGAGISGSGARP